MSISHNIPERTLRECLEIVEVGAVNAAAIAHVLKDTYIPAVLDNNMLLGDGEPTSLDQAHISHFVDSVTNMVKAAENGWDAIYSGQHKGPVNLYPPFVYAVKQCAEVCMSEETIVLHNPLFVFPMSQIRQLCQLPMPNGEYDAFRISWAMMDMLLEEV